MSIRRTFDSLARIALLGLLFAATHVVAAAPPPQLSFATPADAARALYVAVREEDTAAMTQILGPGSADLVNSGDPTEDGVARIRFIAAYEQSMRIEVAGPNRAHLVIGLQDWVLPFPLVRDAKRGWRFDAREGRSEVIARRVGRNELAAIQAVLAYVDAQREYAVQSHDGVAAGAYARRIASERGRHDGLYWEPTRDGPLSPLGLQFTLAAADETVEGEATPYHGYFFRVLDAQGAQARGGAMDYVVNGRMIGGFALAAYPARYRVTGVRTFIVSHEGIVFSRDLGAKTATLARAMRRFDPDRSWRREASAATHSEGSDRMARLAGEYGCTLCHREKSSPRAGEAALPLAPSWHEIAARYRGRPDAEEVLTRVVIEGADPSERHWSERLEFTNMGSNEIRVTPDEARALVRWILGSP